MTRKEWLERAEDYERLAQEALENDDVLTHEYYHFKAHACRTAACYAREEDEKEKSET